MLSSTTTQEEGTAALEERALAWSRDFETALALSDEPALRELFVEDSYWGDRLAFTWDARQSWGRDAILERIIPAAQISKPTDFSIAQDRTEPEEVAGGAFEVFYDFRTAFGTARALITFVPDARAASGLRARILSTDLATLDAVGDHTKITRHPKYGWDKSHPGQTYSEHRKYRGDYEDREPEVLVVGGSQSGVSVAAQLERLGVDALVVEKNANTGDAWRNRYDSLALHTRTDMNDTPFTRFPDMLPEYLVKDRWADWLDAFPKMMDLNVWTSTEFINGEYDEKAQRWTVTLRRSDGSKRTLHPVHLVLAVGGVGGQPRIPKLAGLDDFAGTVVHSSGFTTGADWAGKKVLVVGSGTSAHDISLDLVTHGAAEVTMIQRSAIPVVNIDTANVAYGYYFDPSMTQAEADQRFAQGAIYPILIESMKGYTQFTNQVEKELLDGLAKAGMKLDTGEDETGWLMKFLRYGGGYYLNVGASDAIIAGDIKLLPNENIDRYTTHGVLLTDGSEKEADLIVLATGYENLINDVERLLGKEVAEKVGSLGGFGEDGEILNRCRVTKQEHLWFMFGGIGDLRSAVPRMSLHIKAQLAGIIPTFVRGDDNELVPVQR